MGAIQPSYAYWVVALADGPDASLWVGASGLNRFDGLRFIDETDRSYQQLMSITALSFAPDSVLWIGSGQGVLRRVGGSYAPAVPQVVYPTGSDSVTALLADSAGRVWVGTSGGISLLEGGSWRAVSSLTEPNLIDDSIRDIKEDPDGSVWIASSRGISRVNGGTWTGYPYPNFGDIIRAIAPDGKGGVWVCTGTSGLVHWRSGSWSMSPGLLGGAETDAEAIATDNTGTVWVASMSGAYTYHPRSRTWRRYTPQDGLPQPWQSVVHRAPDGAIWLWGLYSGLARFDGSEWRAFAAADGLLDDFGISIAADTRANAVWCGTFYDGIYRYDTSGWQHFGPADGVKGTPNSHANMLLVDSRGNLWGSTDSAGVLSRPSGGNFTYWDSTRGLLSNQVHCVFADDSTAAMWFGTDVGVGRLDLSDSSWTSLSGANVPGLQDVTSILRNRLTGDLWFATGDSGIFIRHGSSWSRLRSPDPLPSDLIRRLLQASNGDIWVGTSYQGCGRITPTGASTRYSVSDGMTDNYVSDICEDTRGGIWFTSPTNAVSRFFEGEWGGYNKTSQLLGPWAATVGLDGELWFATNNGATRYVPDYVAPHTRITQAPPAAIGARSVTITYAAGFKENASEITYASSLDGGARTNWTSEAFLHYEGLSDGPHTVLVWARDGIGNVESSPPRVDFVVDATPPSPVLDPPGASSVVKGTLAINGDVSDARFASYSVEVRALGDSTWKTIVGNAPRPTTRLLAHWATNAPGFADGPWQVRVSVNDTLGLVGYASDAVILDNYPPSASVTTPAQVSRDQGGDVYTIDGGVRFYFPPYFFRGDAVVQVQPLTRSATQAGDSIVVGCNVSWSASTAGRSGLVDFVVPRSAMNDPLAIFQQDGQGNWLLKSRDRDPATGHMMMAFQDSGSYALIRDNGSITVAKGLTELSIAPPVFSPEGHFASTTVGIAFAMGSAGRVQVAVYNPAGRLVRQLVDGQILPAGRQVVTWDGKDAHGTIVPDGLYLVQVDTNGQSKRRGVSVVR